jgi:energy-coupling factor transporter ATP-binding protein EcfA2
MSEETVNEQPDLLTVESHTETPCYVLDLTVENVRSFGSPQTLDLSDGRGRPIQWTILLGDNGSGKTTLLQSLAAIVPREFSTQTAPAEPSEQKHYVPAIFPLLVPEEKYRTLSRVNTIKFKISAHLTYGAKLEDTEAKHRDLSIMVQIAAQGSGSAAASYPSELKDFLVYGYGAARRIGLTSLSETRDSDPQATLFDENCSLLNAEEWLLQADYAAEKSKDPKAVKRLERIKEILVRLLPDVAELRIQPSGTRTPFVEALTPYGWVMMRALSSGYRSVVAWMVDLASRMFDRYPTSSDPLAEPAVVLVDQIDAFLHPKWQRELVQNLTAIFRNTQFVVTAHSPLIVQAATEAKIVLLRREGDHVIIDNRAETVQGWRLDQIVSSDLFENLGTRDPKTEKLLEQRKFILTKSHLSPDDKHALQVLEGQIGSLRFGQNADEAKAMEIIERAAKKLQSQSL